MSSDNAPGELRNAKVLVMVMVRSAQADGAIGVLVEVQHQPPPAGTFGGEGPHAVQLVIQEHGGQWHLPAVEDEEAITLVVMIESYWLLPG